jgi:hypothetical protein
MANLSIGPKGFIELTTAQTGPVRKLRICAFTGRSTTGACDSTGFRPSDALASVIDMTKGRIVTGSFGAISNGSIALADTGGLGADGAFTGHELLAVTLNDTGTAG